MEKKETREQWLADAVGLLEEHVFIGYEVPSGIAVSCGFPSTNALPRKGSPTRIGECWKREASEGGETIHIFISPTLVKPIDVLAALGHELIHAIKPEAKHGAEFKRIAAVVGFFGPATATQPGVELVNVLTSIAEMLGEYPHDKLVPVIQHKTQATRLLKAECPTCGYVIRLTKKWADAGLPQCRSHIGGGDDCCGWFVLVTEQV